ncbi:hypothetical protein CQA86_32590, partial [Klebsiella pneumoniae]
DRLGHRGSIVAFSRHGLLSRGNLSGAGATWPGDYQQGSLTGWATAAVSSPFRAMACCRAATLAAQGQPGLAT